MNQLWYSNREREIPERLLAKWRQAKKQYGGLRLQEALELAELDPNQLNDLHLYKLGQGRSILDGQHILKLAHRLTDAQWQAATGLDGLPVASLRESQLDLLFGWIRSTHGERVFEPEGKPLLDDRQRIRDAMLSLEKSTPESSESDETKRKWDFRLRLGDKSVCHQFDLESLNDVLDPFAR